MQCVAPFDYIISHYSSRTLLSRHPHTSPSSHGPKPFSELGEHSDYHLLKRRLSCTLSIAVDQLECKNKEAEQEGDIQLIEERLESLH